MSLRPERPNHVWSYDFVPDRTHDHRVYHFCNISADLTMAGSVASTKRLATSSPRLGESVAGDPWFIDGKAAVVGWK